MNNSQNANSKMIPSKWSYPPRLTPKIPKPNDKPNLHKKDKKGSNTEIPKLKKEKIIFASNHLPRLHQSFLEDTKVHENPIY